MSFFLFQIHSEFVSDSLKDFPGASRTLKFLVYLNKTNYIYTYIHVCIEKERVKTWSSAHDYFFLIRGFKVVKKARLMFNFKHFRVQAILCLLNKRAFYFFETTDCIKFRTTDWINNSQQVFSPTSRARLIGDAFALAKNGQLDYTVSI